ncbi:MAG: hypothetical protein R3D65_13295 [Zhengella sp.]
MTFKKPNEIIGNHIAKYQAMRLAKVLMAYDFDRQMNLHMVFGGFCSIHQRRRCRSTTGKTILIQTAAMELINDYAQVAGCRSITRISASTSFLLPGPIRPELQAFIDNVLNPRCISFRHWTISTRSRRAVQTTGRKRAARDHQGAQRAPFAPEHRRLTHGNCSLLFPTIRKTWTMRCASAPAPTLAGGWTADAGGLCRHLRALAGKNHAIPLGEHDLFAHQQDHAKPSRWPMRSMQRRRRACARCMTASQ